MGWEGWDLVSFHGVFDETCYEGMRRSEARQEEMPLFCLLFSSSFPPF